MVETTPAHLQALHFGLVSHALGYNPSLFAFSFPPLSNDKAVCPICFVIVSLYFCAKKNKLFTQSFSPFFLFCSQLYFFPPFRTNTSKESSPSSYDFLNTHKPFPSFSNIFRFLSPHFIYPPPPCFSWATPKKIFHRVIRMGCLGRLPPSYTRYAPYSLPLHLTSSLQPLSFLDTVFFSFFSGTLQFHLETPIMSLLSFAFSSGFFSPFLISFFKFPLRPPHLHLSQIRGPLLAPILFVSPRPLFLELLSPQFPTLYFPPPLILLGRITFPPWTVEASFKRLLPFLGRLVFIKTLLMLKSSNLFTLYLFTPPNLSFFQMKMSFHSILPLFHNTSFDSTN